MFEMLAERSTDDAPTSGTSNLIDEMIQLPQKRPETKPLIGESCRLEIVDTGMHRSEEREPFLSRGSAVPVAKIDKVEAAQPKIFETVSSDDPRTARTIKRVGGSDRAPVWELKDANERTCRIEEDRNGAIVSAVMKDARGKLVFSISEDTMTIPTKDGKAVRKQIETATMDRNRDEIDVTLKDGTTWRYGGDGSVMHIDKYGRLSNLVTANRVEVSFQYAGKLVPGDKTSSIPTSISFPAEDLEYLREQSGLYRAVVKNKNPFSVGEQDGHRSFGLQGRGRWGYDTIPVPIAGRQKIDVSPNGELTIHAARTHLQKLFVKVTLRPDGTTTQVEERRPTAIFLDDLLLGHKPIVSTRNFTRSGEEIRPAKK
jgi:hypothetical protein